MVRVGVSITKTTTFRNGNQEFSNVYYFDGLVSIPTVAQADGIMDDITTKEKTWHSTLASFKKARIWVQTGDKSTTNMISQKTLSGTGARNLSTMDKERAFLFRLRAGNDSRGNAVYLRKWYHTIGEFVPGQTIPGNVLSNIDGFTQAERDAQTAHLGNIGAISGGAGVGTICSKNGRTSTAGAQWEAHKYLEHRQLGDQWRAT